MRPLTSRPPLGRPDWPEIEQFLGDLPPPLFEQGVLLKNQLALEYSDTGQFTDILSRAQDHPLLYLPGWLAGDVSLSPRPAVATAMFFAFATAYLQKAILAGSTGFDQRYAILAQLLAQQSDVYLARHFSGDSPFWRHHRRFWQEFAGSLLLGQSPNLPDTPDAGEESGWPAAVTALAAGRWAFTKIPAAAIAVEANQPASLAGWAALFDRFNFIFQVWRDLTRLKPAVMQRRYSPALLWAFDIAGLDPRQPRAPESMLGALVLSGALVELCQRLREQLVLCRQSALEAGWVTVESYLAGWEVRLRQLQTLFDLRSGSVAAAAGVAPPQPGLVFTPHVDQLAAAVQSAEAYLLADLTFRESWEVQRGLVPGRAEITATAFPTGLIIESLCRCGHSLPAQVGHVFETLHANDFRYYDYPGLPPDADDLGLLLRLWPYSAPDRLAGHRALLQTPLAWLAASVRPSGEIPVWFVTATTGWPAEPEPLVWGGSCATTETNLLLGLIDYDWEAYRPLVERSALSVLARFARRGWGATLYYQPPYIIWAALTLLEALLARSDHAALLTSLHGALPHFLEQFESESRRVLLTPQRAAFFLSTSQLQVAGHRLDPRWVKHLLSRQRHDGSWAAEALFLIPHRRGSGWYASRLVTTAFCYRALKLISSGD